MPTKIIFKLKPTSSPHLYVDQLKQMISLEKTISPQLKQALILMKKTRMPYVMLAITKEMVLYPEKNLHLEHATEPSVTGWAKILWNESEIKKYKKSRILFEEEMFDLYNKLGYEIVATQKMSKEQAEEILKLCK